MLIHSSLLVLGRPPFRHRPDLPICDQHSHLSRHQWQDRRGAFRNTLHPTFGRYDMGILVKHNGRRLAYAGRWRRHIYLRCAFIICIFAVVMIDVILASASCTMYFSDRSVPQDIIVRALYGEVLEQPGCLAGVKGAAQERDPPQERNLG